MPNTSSARPLPQLRPQATVNNGLDKKLAAYVAAASAAGVAMLATATPAAAEVLYTPIHVKIARGHTIHIDLNHDGIADFAIQICQCGSHSSMLQALLEQPGNMVVAGQKFEGGALALGAPIGSHRQFTSRTSYGGILMAIAGGYGSNSWFIGSWANASNKYLGLKFLVDGQVHYGWARLSVTNYFKYGQATLTGFAYETEVNQGILAGKESGTDERSAAGPAELEEPVSPIATLGMLACGADGLALWRREEESRQI